MSARPPAPGRRLVSRLVMAAVMLGWGVTLTVPPLLLLRERSGWLERFGRAEQQAHWEDFRRDMARQSGRDGPVQRKVPKSPEPPIRVWLRDHSALAVTAWVLFVGVLGGFFSLLVVGVLRADGRPSLAEDHAGGQRDHQEEDQRDAKNTKQ